MENKNICLVRSPPEGGILERDLKKLSVVVVVVVGVVGVGLRGYHCW